jgi:hypothetical protein
VARIAFTANIQRHVACPEAEAVGRTVREVLENVFAENRSAAVWSSAYSSVMLHLQINRPGQQLGKSASRERDVDAIGSDFHAAEQCHERRFDFVWCVGSKVFRNLMAAFDQLAAS